MARRHVHLIVAVAFALALAAGTNVVGGRIYPEQRPLIVTGHLCMVTSPDGLTTVVSIDMGDTEHPPDGLVDHAFRLQHKTAQALTYDGMATITYLGTRLSIEVDDQSGWVFSVDGTETPLSDRELAYRSFFVFGLSHHWGGKVHQSAEQVAALLLATGCTTLLGDPSCDTCEAGGPGVQGCAVECDGGSGCSANCAPGAFACCNCPGGCRCCAPKEGGVRKGGVQLRATR
jgi:hypothetical protein